VRSEPDEVRGDPHDLEQDDPERGRALRHVDPENPLQQVFTRANFPDDLEDLAAAIEATVEENKASILLVFVDVIEHQGRHIRSFYETMAGRFKDKYGPHFEELRRQGRLADADPIVAVMVATRWLFYFYTVEKCFGVPMHFGMGPEEAVHGFIQLLRQGLLPRSTGSGDAKTTGP